MRVFCSLRAVGGESFGAGLGRGGGRSGVRVEEGEQHKDVFETGVHALAVERDHCMGGVAENDTR